MAETRKQKQVRDALQLTRKNAQKQPFICKQTKNHIKYEMQIIRKIIEEGTK